MKRVVVCALILLTGFSACKKGESFDAVKQAAIDEKLLQSFITANSITAKKDNSGLYYVISNPGSGNLVFTANTNITIKYTGRFLDGTVFETATFTYPLGGLIDGWQIGVPLIQKGGKIRLLIPSALAYREFGQSVIPPNAVLDFDIELIDATN